MWGKLDGISLQNAGLRQDLKRAVAKCEFSAHFLNVAVKGVLPQQRAPEVYLA